MGIDSCTSTFAEMAAITLPDNMARLAVHHCNRNGVFVYMPIYLMFIEFCFTLKTYLTGALHSASSSWTLNAHPVLLRTPPGRAHKDGTPTARPCGALSIANESIGGFSVN